MSDEFRDEMERLCAEVRAIEDRRGTMVATATTHRVIRDQDRRIEELRSDLATVFRWARRSAALFACALAGGTVASVAVGEPALASAGRLAAFVACLVLYRRVRAAERERGL